MLFVNTLIPFTSHDMFYQQAEHPMFILVAGKPGAGKTTFSNMLVDVFKLYGMNSERRSFASGVKKYARDVLKWDGSKDKAGRKLLQFVGEHGRLISNGNKWASEVMKDLDNLDVIVIDDFRYPNEYLEIASRFYNTFTVKIETPLSKFEDIDRDILYHPSESSLDSFPLWHFLVYNRKESLDELKETAFNLFLELFG